MEHDLTNLRAAYKAFMVWMIDQQITQYDKDDEEKISDFRRTCQPLIKLCDTISDENLIKSSRTLLNIPSCLDKFPEDLRNRFLEALANIT